MSESALPRQCPQCGGSMPSDSPEGLCPRCLMKAAMASQAQTTDTIRSSAYDSGSSTVSRRMPFDPPSVEVLAPHFPQLEIIELLGQGGMGAVYKARQRGLDRVIALKILPPGLSERPGFAERFTREARALARLNHPNIVSVFDFGRTGPSANSEGRGTVTVTNEFGSSVHQSYSNHETSGLFFFIMEFIDGTNLRQAIRAKAMTPIEALAIVPQICDALQYAHEEGVVHRDIKPENILIDKRGKVKIADFGLAKLVEGAPDDITLTREGGTMGTPHYMAPEQLERAHEVDHRADIYSLGVVFYEMLTGELPLGRFAPPSKKVQVDVRLDEVVLRSLEKEPQLRWQQASEVKTQVDEIRGLSPAMVEGLKRATGREYKSKATLFGLPLVHIATGLDPRTGRPRVATGIIAMGDVAVGGIACGGAAFGVFTFGGVGIGLVSFSGLAIALLAAIGGLAIGGFAFGGVAVGGIALGGLAVGYYASGGMALGVHVMSSSTVDPQAREFFTSWAGDWPRWLAIIGIASPLLVGITSLIMWLALGSKRSTSGWPGQDSNSGNSGGGSAADRPNSALPSDTDADILRQLHAPAVWLAGTAVLNWILATILIVLMSMFGLPHLLPGREPVPVETVLLASAITMIGSGIMLFGSLKMRRLEGRGIALLGAVLAMIITPGNIIGLPVGIWVLEVLHRRKVREAFGRPYNDDPAPFPRGGQPAQQPQPALGGAFVCSVIALVLFALGIAVPPIVLAMNLSNSMAMAATVFCVCLTLAILFGLIGRKHRMGRITAGTSFVVLVGCVGMFWLSSSGSVVQEPAGPRNDFGPLPGEHRRPNTDRLTLPAAAAPATVELRLAVLPNPRFDAPISPSESSGNDLRKELAEQGPTALHRRQSEWRWFELLVDPVSTDDMLIIGEWDDRKFLLLANDSKYTMIDGRATQAKDFDQNVHWRIDEARLVKDVNDSERFSVEVTVNARPAVQMITQWIRKHRLAVIVGGKVLGLSSPPGTILDGKLTFEGLTADEADRMVEALTQGVVIQVSGKIEE